MKKNNSNYVAIDLGTTNSLIGFGIINHKGKIEPKVIEINMRTRDGVKKYQQLPSVIYFKKDESPIVGRFGKENINVAGSKVVSSIKSHMGSIEKLEFNNKKYSASEISSMILKHLANAAESILGYIPNDVIITVPASFDSDMRKDTIEAARLAGFKVENKDGTLKNILIDEPRAAMYDFINKQENGDIPESLINLNEAKNILVYDLGGGTLDVSLHKVKYTGDECDIDDYATSRYTRIGGDDFDKLITENMFNVFKKEVDISGINELEEKAIKGKFRICAEEAKIELSSYATNCKMMGNEIDVKKEADILITDAYDGNSFEYYISLEKYERLVESLLGKNLNIKNIENFEELKYENTQNIIYPILDVLVKAKAKVGKKVNVDAVLLNGGMTSFKIIKERIEDFFGIKVITALDPDKAVVRGGVVHHYNIKNGKRIKSIVNETIGIKVEGGAVKHLVEAGTVLPCKNTINNLTVTEEERVIDIPIYLGGLTTTEPPNRKLASKRIKFENTLKSGDDVQMMIEVDTMNIITLLVKVNGEEAKIKIDGAEVEKPLEKEIKKINELEKIEAKNNSLNQTDFSIKIDIKSTVQKLIDNILRYEKLKDGVIKDGYIKKIKEIEKEIVRAKNGKDSIEILERELFRFKSWGKGRIYYLLGEVAKANKEVGNDVIKILNKEINSKIMFFSDKAIINNIIKNIVIALGKTENILAEKVLLNINKDNKLRMIRQDIVIALGKTAKSIESINTIKNVIQCSGINERSAGYWALGKIGTRECENPVEIKKMSMVLGLLMDAKKDIKIERFDLARNKIYAIGEICDRRTNKDSVSIDIAKKGEKIIECIELVGSIEEKVKLDKMKNISRVMMAGKILSKQENEFLIGIRSLLTAK